VTRSHFPEEWSPGSAFLFRKTSTKSQFELAAVYHTYSLLSAEHSVYDETKDRDITRAIYRINHTCSLTGKLSASIIRLINEGTSLPLLVSRPTLLQCSHVNLLQQISFISRNESKLVFRKFAVFLCHAQAFMFVSVCACKRRCNCHRTVQILVLQTITTVTSLRLHLA